MLLPTGARLFEGPGLWLQHAKTGYQLHDDWMERIRPMQVVGETDEFFAIRTHHDEPNPSYCYAARDLFRGFDLVVYVPKSDVLPVLTDRVTRQWHAGASLLLEPGLGLIPLGANRYRAVARPFGVEIELPEQVVGKAYLPTTGPTHTARPPHLFEIRNRSTEIVLGTGVDVQLLGGSATIREVEPHPQGAFVTLAARCGQLRAIVPQRDVVRVPEVGTGSGYGTTCGGVVPGVDFHVRPRTRVYWRDGRFAGRTTHRSSLHAYDRTNAGDLACFPKSPNRFGCGNERVQLCIRSDELMVIPVEPSPDDRES